MRTQWWNDYIGLTYVPRGRERAGLDCWGLVRLVYAEERGIELPSLADEYQDHYAHDERDLLAELIAAKREHWVSTDAPQSGDVVVLRILGAESHVGLITEPGFFLHIRSGADSVIERLDGTMWRKRVAGIYRYSEQPPTGLVTLAACPHPLRSARIDGKLPAGLTLAQMVELTCDQAGIPTELRTGGVIYLDGEYISAADWAITVPDVGSRVEYRAVARGSNALRTIATIALVVFVAVVAAPALASMAGFTAGTASFALASAGISMGLNMVGSMLINSIFPVRPNEMGAGMAGSLAAPQAIKMLQGGRNNETPYAAVPVVLGQMRYTPPVGANTYVETVGSVSYLRMVLVWGYGPLQVSDLRIGNTPLSDFKEVEISSLVGWSDTAQELAHFNSLYGKDVTQDMVGAQLAQNVAVARVMTSAVDRISVDFHYPSGLYKVISATGKLVTLNSRIKIEYRLAGALPWMAVNETLAALAFNLLPAHALKEFDWGLWTMITYPVFQWTRISIDVHNKIIIRHGSLTDGQYAEPSSALTTMLKRRVGYATSIHTRLPALGVGEIELYQICVQESAVLTTLDMRPVSVTGASLTLTGLTASIAAAAVTRTGVELDLTKATNKAFGESIQFNVPHGTYEVRVTKQSDDLTQDASAYLYSVCVLNSITGYANNRPIAFPKGLAMTAIRIRATDQINGNVDGITGTAHAICLDWTGTAWVKRATRNPASLFRLVLQHPANAKALADSQIDLVKLQYWHNYCDTNGFMFDMLVNQQRSLLDVLRDIAAAGRASPTLSDGLWTVVIDEPRTQIAQLFTPHNSWGFKGVRALPKLPHGFRVTFNNAQKAYQPDEMIVYADGYTSANATLFEGLSLPGVTEPAVIHKHARFHLAQVILRPESYTLNADIEHLVCTRGDLVRLVHDVPEWGLGSGRIRDLVMAGANVSGVVLDEEMPMVAGQTYTLRYRRGASGASFTATVAAKPTDGYYTALTFAAAITANLPAVGDLILFGSLNAESVELIVNSITPGDNMTAQLTLVDYSPAVYTSDTEVIPAFDSQITAPPILHRKVITAVPQVTSIISDESVMQRLSPAKFAYRIRVGFSLPNTLPGNVHGIQGQIDFAGDTTLNWHTTVATPTSAHALFFDNVQEGDAYRFRLRYIDDAGTVGPWGVIYTHTVSGKSSLPSDVTGFDATRSGNALYFKWDVVGDIDLGGYEIRLGAVWDTAILLARTKLDHLAHVSPLGGTYLIKAFDLDSPVNYSAVAAECILAANDTLNIVVLDDDATYGWPGVKTGMVKDGNGHLQLGYTKTWNDLTAPWSAYQNDWMSTSGPLSSGSYQSDAHDLGSVMTCNVSLTPEVERLNLNQTWAMMTQPWSYYGKNFPWIGAVGAIQAIYEIRTSNDNVTWTPWRVFIPGLRTLRYFQIRASFTALPGYQVLLKSLRMLLDVPDRVLNYDNLAITSAGRAITFNPPFTSIKVISCSLLDGVAGDRYRITNKTVNGLTVEVLNAAGALIAGTVDLRVHGYGP